MDFFRDSLLQPGFNWRAALSLASASKLAYNPAEAIRQRVTEDWRFRLTAIFDKGDTQGFAMEDDGVLVVVFRGTDSVADWLDNIQISSTMRDYGAVHKGFFGAWTRVAGPVTECVRTAAGKKKAIWLAGHSLGGAVALTAALELPAGIALHGLQTFGQPRMLSGNASTFANTRLGGVYQRFVNNADLVTRLPPHFGHAGALIHFDARGGATASGRLESEEGVTTEPPPVSQLEFEAIKHEIKAIKASLAATEGMAEWSDPRSRDEIVDAAAAGLLPGLRDHRIDSYLALIRRHAGVSVSGFAAGSLSEIAAEMATLRASRGAAPESDTGRGPLVFGHAIELEGVDAEIGFGAEAAAPVEEVHVPVQRYPFVLRLRRPDWRPPVGLRVSSHIGNFATMLATEAEVEALHIDPDVLSIEVSRDAGMPDLDQSLAYTGAVAIHRPPINERGEAALVGIVDSGIDILHEAFLDAAGRTRIVAIWNQHDATGPTPYQVDPARFSQDHGTVYTASEIDAFIDAFIHQGKAPPVMLRDPAGHGTHVASIAAGRAVGALSDGIAPEARIALVIPNMKTTPGSPPSLGYSTSHLDGMAFLKALSHGGTRLLADPLPLAINVSLGMNAGAHDGTSTLEAGFDAMTGIGREPGCVIVKSAGNERGHGGHARVTAAFGVVPIRWRSTSRHRLQDYFEAWFDDLDDIAFTLVDPAGNRSGTVSFDAPRVVAMLGGNSCALTLMQGHSDNGDHCLTLTISPVSAGIREGMWTLEAVGRKIRSADALVDIWVERTDERAITFTPEDETMTLSVPGTAATVVTVGASNSLDPPTLNASSSYGPTRDKRSKPELSAPGFQIMAAAANTPDRRATIGKSGTSMAAPHVTGALALVMSRRHKQAGRPQFNAVQLQAFVRRAVQRFSHVPHPGFGHGVLDIRKLFDEAFPGAPSS